MKILIAEDEFPIRVYSGDLMEYWGYRYDVAKNGLEAVEMAWAKNGEYDLCLMDIDMPIMDGVEASRYIRKKTKYFPILALSANSYIEENYARAGFDGFLGKPWDMDTLEAKIRELTVKEYSVRIGKNDFKIQKETPVDQQHLMELMSLAKDDLCKMNIRGIGSNDLVVVTHKNVPNKISRDFIEEKLELSVFLDRSEEKPSECHLYKSSCPLPTIYLTEKEYEEKRKQEDELLKNCSRLVFKNKD